MFTDEIKKRLDEYLEFNSDVLFTNDYYLVRVFGGAIRDIIAKQPINDVDILIGTKARGFIESILTEQGYRFVEYLNGKDLQEMYSEILVICEPHTWIKGDKIIQLIRPSINANIDSYKESFTNLIANVDLSCCGVSWDGHQLHEDYPGAIVHCQNKVFSVNKKAKMYSIRRVAHRIHKLCERGWNEVEYSEAVNRDLKLKLII